MISPMQYRVTAGETYLRDKNDKPKASIFSFAYVRTDSKDVRPVTFVWNGGPGSASLWLHMGTFGPRRVSLPSDALHPGAPPYPVVDAPETILDVSDLVFVDPVGTGYSRALGSHKGKEFWGLDEDAQSMAEFIRHLRSPSMGAGTRRAFCSARVSGRPGPPWLRASSKATTS